jgi:hypothetical protein
MIRDEPEGTMHFEIQDDPRVWLLRRIPRFPRTYSGPGMRYLSRLSTLHKFTLLVFTITSVEQTTSINKMTADENHLYFGQIFAIINVITIVTAMVMAVTSMDTPMEWYSSVQEYVSEDPWKTTYYFFRFVYVCLTQPFVPLPWIEGFYLLPLFSHDNFGNQHPRWVTLIYDVLAWGFFSIFLALLCEIVVHCQTIKVSEVIPVKFILALMLPIFLAFGKDESYEQCYGLQDNLLASRRSRQIDSDSDED